MVMATDVVTISKEEYDLLVQCKHIVKSEFEENFSKKFIMAVEESEDEYKKGDVVIVKNSEERKKLFESL